MRAQFVGSIGDNSCTLKADIGSLQEGVQRREMFRAARVQVRMLGGARIVCNSAAVAGVMEPGKRKWLANHAGYKPFPKSAVASRYHYSLADSSTEMVKAIEDVGEQAG